MSMNGTSPPRKRNLKRPARKLPKPPILTNQNLKDLPGHPAAIPLRDGGRPVRLPLNSLRNPAVNLRLSGPASLLLNPVVNLRLSRPASPLRNPAVNLHRSRPASLPQNPAVNLRLSRPVSLLLNPVVNLRLSRPASLLPNRAVNLHRSRPVSLLPIRQIQRTVIRPAPSRRAVCHRRATMSNARPVRAAAEVETATRSAAAATGILRKTYPLAIRRSPVAVTVLSMSAEKATLPPEADPPWVVAR